MCGITGIINYKDTLNIEAMTRILSHRGPDDWGIKVFPESRVALGHTRLSIIDLSTAGHQPMHDASGLLWITYNGEIYNYREIRKELLAKGYSFRSNADTEVILNAYHCWGVGCLKKFNGMFAFAIWDERNRTLFAARDHIGIKPFYYYFDKDTFVFASEIKSIIASGYYQPLPDYEGLQTPYMFQTWPKTGFKNVFKLKPGNYLIFKNKQLQFHTYWQFEPEETLTDEKIAAAELEALLLKAVERQMIADVPVGAFLSGGLDSSIIVAMMKRFTHKPIHTFTIKYRKEDQKAEQMPDDSKYARKVADHFGCIHHEVEIEPDIIDLLPKMIWHLDEPLADPAAINTYMMSKLARENGIVVLLNGMGGDEIFGGYRTQLACLLAEDYQRYVPYPIRQMIKASLEMMPVAIGKRGIRTVRWARRFTDFADLPPRERYYAGGWGIVSPEEFSRLYARVNGNGQGFWNCESVREQSRVFETGNISYLTQMNLSMTQYFLPDHNLNYSDKSTMATGVESRPPLTDHTIVEYMFQTAPQLRICGRTQKYLLKKVAEKYLPKEIIRRPKAPFGSPIRGWIRGPLAELIDEYLSPRQLQKRGIYHPQFVWEKIRQDRAGIADNAHLIWTLLCREIWFQQFMDTTANTVPPQHENTLSS